MAMDTKDQVGHVGGVTTNTEYMVVIDRSWDDFEHAVNGALNEGWKCQGGYMAGSGGNYSAHCQAMTREREEKE